MERQRKEKGRKKKEKRVERKLTGIYVMRDRQGATTRSSCDRTRLEGGANTFLNPIRRVWRR